VSTLHPDIRELSALLYEGLRRAGLGAVALTEDQTTRYAKALAILESQGYLAGTHTFSRRFAAGIDFRNPHFVTYLAALFEDTDKMDALMERLEACPSGAWLKGAEIAEQLALPLRTVWAVFDLAAARGLGLLSNEVGTANYMART
jgi:hypothetical protein